MQNIEDINLHRPVHETERDRDREYQCLHAVAELRGLGVTLFPKMYPLDAVFYKNRDAMSFMSYEPVCCFVEHRRRYVDRDKYPDIAMTISKYIYGLNLSRQFGIKFVVLWDFNDGVWARVVPDGLAPKLFAGNTGSKDRGDAYDTEAVVMIPNDDEAKFYLKLEDA